MKDVMEMFLLTQETTNVLEDVKEKQNAAAEDVEKKKKKFLQKEEIIEDAADAFAAHADAIGKTIIT